MQKYLYITLILSITLSSIKAQGGWKQKYFLQNSFVSTSLGVIEIPNGNFICIGLTTDTINNKYNNKLTLIGVNSIGNFLWRKDYGNVNFEYLLSFSAVYAAICKDNNSFFYTVCVRDSNKYVGALIKFNFNGDTLWQKVYRDTMGYIVPQGITKSRDNGFLITGYFENIVSGATPCLILKTDKNGNELWRKKIQKVVPNYNLGNGIIQDSATKKIVITGQQYIGGATYQSVYSNVLICDSLGNKIVHTTLNNAGGGGFSDVIQLKDGNFLSCGGWTHHSINGDHYLNGYVVKFDINGTEIWSKRFFNPEIQNSLNFCTELNNGELVIIGKVKVHNLISEPDQMKTVLIKLDKNGKVLSQNFVGHSSNTLINENPTSINKTADKGFIIATQFLSMRNPTPYSIVKLDSTFCDTTTQWCQSVVLAVGNYDKITGYEFNMYPNPANEMINVILRQAQGSSDYKQTNNNAGTQIKITNISGKQIELITIVSETNIQLNTSQYQAGIYFVSILINNNAIETKKLVIVR